MITHLSLSQFILVEKADISFTRGFNILTGETGSGKTALLDAIALLLGARADTSAIRQGAERACIEALFDPSLSPALPSLLSDAGITYTAPDELSIRREITREGKNRAFIQCQPVSLPFLQKVGRELIDVVDQQAVLGLRSSEEQRAFLDLFGELQPQRQQFQTAFEKEKKLAEQIEGVKQLETKRDSLNDFLTFQLQEIDDAQIDEEEEEGLFEEYARLNDAEHTGEQARTVMELLCEHPESILTQMKQLCKAADALTKSQKQLEEASSLLHNAHLLLQEAACRYQKHIDTLTPDPHRLEHLEKRLSQLARLKKKYGPTLRDVLAQGKKLRSELAECQEAPTRLSELQEQRKKAHEEVEAQALRLTQGRRKAAEQLEKLLTDVLRTLNMPKAELHIEIIPQTRGQMGDEEVHFTLRANPGEKFGLVREHTSGGELARLLLALKLLLAEKNKIPTLLFDEVDATIGGETARLIGMRLSELGKRRQILCITHFPQVAAEADCHIAVKKEEVSGRTHTSIQVLTPREKEKELLRMLGGIKI